MEDEAVMNQTHVNSTPDCVSVVSLFHSFFLLICVGQGLSPRPILTFTHGFPVSASQALPSR